MDADLDGRRFDKVFAIHVPVFLRGDPTAEMRVVRRCLAAGGRLYLFSQPLDPGAAQATADDLRDVVDRSGLELDRIRIDPLSAAPGVCAVAAAR